MRKQKPLCVQTSRVVSAFTFFFSTGEAEHLSLLSSLPAESRPCAKNSKLHALQQACRWTLRNSANPTSCRARTWRPEDFSPCQLSIYALASRCLSETCIYRRQTCKSRSLLSLKCPRADWCFSRIHPTNREMRGLPDTS
jgi:hypothetical protein